MFIRLCMGQTISNVHLAFYILLKMLTFFRLTNYFHLRIHFVTGKKIQAILDWRPISKKCLMN